jgi:Na+/H+ antiporter NhaD/arsenite permease-like protein
MNVAAVDASVAAGIQERHPEVASMSVEALQTSLQQFGGFLKAISMGAVFMGANTYIGNAPNFMVRSIAIQDGVKMPSFFGVMAWSCAILIPIFVVVTLLFLVLI